MMRYFTHVVRAHLRTSHTPHYKSHNKFHVPHSPLSRDEAVNKPPVPWTLFSAIYQIHGVEKGYKPRSSGLPCYMESRAYFWWQ